MLSHTRVGFRGAANNASPAAHCRGDHGSTVASRREPRSGARNLATRPTSRHRAPQSVAFVITSLGHYGADVQVVALARAFRKRGWSVGVISLIDAERPTKDLADAGIEVARPGNEARVPDPRSILRLRRILRRWRPTVVHAHMIHASLLTRVRAPFCADACARVDRPQRGRGGSVALRCGQDDPLGGRRDHLCQCGRGPTSGAAWRGAEPPDPGRTKRDRTFHQRGRARSAGRSTRAAGPKRCLRMAGDGPSRAPEGLPHDACRVRRGVPAMPWRAPPDRR